MKTGLIGSITTFKWKKKQTNKGSKENIKVKDFLIA